MKCALNIHDMSNSASSKCLLSSCAACQIYIKIWCNSKLSYKHTNITGAWSHIWHSIEKGENICHPAYKFHYFL